MIVRLGRQNFAIGQFGRQSGETDHFLSTRTLTQAARSLGTAYARSVGVLHHIQQGAFVCVCVCVCVELGRCSCTT